MEVRKGGGLRPRFRAQFSISPIKQVLETDVRNIFLLARVVLILSWAQCRKKRPLGADLSFLMEGSVYEFGSNLRGDRRFFLEPDHDLRLLVGRGVFLAADEVPAGPADQGHG
ncbi:MAG: hypothetical protein KBA32_15710, partial [Propionivibrio sp.]|uniref:hypothetical protein n=1 Tax=Propionivibrio sp. TaxID=2212460 RepID=UPI001B4D128C